MAMIAEYFQDLALDRRRGCFSLVLKGLLWLLSLLYWLIIAVVSRIRSVRPVSVSSKVISVGNITWGGTGKTPLVELLGKMLVEDGRKVAVLTRGYGRSSAACKAAHCRDASTMGDEPYMLSRKFRDIPVIANSDRAAAALEAQRANKADTLILDDGFQQWGLRKDLEIVTIDAMNPFGNGYLIPRGILREPLRALRRADVFVLTNVDAPADMLALKARLAAIQPAGLIVTARHTPAGLYMLSDPSKECGLERLSAQTAALVCAIGNPRSFRRTVESAKAVVAAEFVFTDHHRYSRADIEFVAQACRRQNIGAIITTEKDAAKIAPLAAGVEGPDILVLRVRLEIIENEEQFSRRLRGIYSA